MERLTGRFKDGGAFILPSVVSQLSPMKSEIIEKLADYEDAEEQGLLLRLPCKVGDTVYLVLKYHKPSLYELKVIDIILRDNELYFDLVDICDEEYSTPISTDDFGKCVFLTREEAEKALADMGV